MSSWTDSWDEGEELAAPSLAAPLSHGSNPNSNVAGRRREDDYNLVAFDSAFGRNSGVFEDETPPLKIGSSVGAPAGPAVSDGETVRRLTPTECERLQALPDGWTAPDELGGPGVYVGSRCVSGVADSVRYAALGDAVTASVSEWIGRRLSADLAREVPA